MKIAMPTDDGERVSAHFGHARYYLVVTIEDGHIISQELRERPDDGHHHDHDHDHHDDGHEHHDHQGHHGHNNKFQLISDCDVLIGGGMGAPAYQRLQAMGLEVVLTDHKQISDVLDDAVQGIFLSNPRRVHQGHH